MSVLPPRWPDESGRRRDVASAGGPWLGLIVSKAVGAAVTRHRVARRIRAAFADTMAQCPMSEATVVVRALPTAADRSSVELAGQLAEVWQHRRVRRLADGVAEERMSTGAGAAAAAGGRR
ncbi:hypothetical protein GCM10009624_35730 [Gordonia sinesedis]